MCKGLKPIGGVYYGASRAFSRGIYEGGVRCLKSEKHDSGVAIEVPVNEETPSCNQGIFVKVSEGLTVYAVW